MRNLQLAFFSIFSGFYMCWMYDYDAIEKDGFFQGYNNTIWIVVLLQVVSMLNWRSIYDFRHTEDLSLPS